MIDELSRREEEELRRACDEGHGWARVMRAGFTSGRRLVLGIDSARPESALAEAAGLPRQEVGGALEAAARWCAAHGLHLLGFPPETGAGEWRYFLAVG